MSGISSLGSFQNPQINSQGPSAKPAAAKDTTETSQAAAPVDAQEAQATKDVATEALIRPDLTKDQAKDLSAQIGQQLSGQSLSIANRSPQALQTAFAA